MTAVPVTLYLDLGSPYAYLTTARIHQLLQNPVEFQPVLLGAIFQRRGWGSWAHTKTRDEGMKEVESRAQRYGLPPIVWPGRWPANALSADRAAVWAGQQHAAEPYVRSVYRRQFANGEDISDHQVLALAAKDADLDPRQLLDAIHHPEIKDTLRSATNEAWDLGVRGVPTVRIDDQLFYGDDRLEDAVACLHGRGP